MLKTLILSASDEAEAICTSDLTPSPKLCYFKYIYLLWWFLIIWKPILYLCLFAQIS